MNRTSLQRESLGSYLSLVEDALQSRAAEIIRRTWARDPALWKQEEPQQKIIRNSLGWLAATQAVRESAAEIAAFVSEVREAGFTHAMLLGMGGSSLCPEVLRRTFGRFLDSPEMLVLDSTDPDTVAAFAGRVKLESTLFIVASKSGTTVEPLSFYKYFYDRVRAAKGERAGENFIAITDPGTLMERAGREAGFRHIFLNPPDIGGRYSALSLFGIVPAALMGLDWEEIVARAEGMMKACGADLPAEENPGARLGCIMGALARAAGRDKLTLVTDESIASLGLWIEQLVAESTGKEGLGIVPVAGEPLGPPSAYGADRLFVAVSVGALDGATEGRLRALEAAGHPVVRRELDDALDLGAEFFLWEIATAVAGALMEINPFDQPNVQESKDRTNQLLAEWKASGALPQAQALVAEGERSIYGARDAASADGTRQASASASPPSLADLLRRHLSQAQPGDYVALLAYIQETERHDELLGELRAGLRDRLRLATTVGYGPRYLHSTGQLHKGGAANGLFLQITDDDHVDLAIPGEPYTFGTLKQAQAEGDFAALLSRDRRALRLHLGSETEAGLRWLLDIIGG